jgi:hypothetical protein
VKAHRALHLDSLGKPGDRRRAMGEYQKVVGIITLCVVAKSLAT